MLSPKRVFFLGCAFMLGVAMSGWFKEIFGHTQEQHWYEVTYDIISVLLIWLIGPAYLISFIYLIFIKKSK